MGAKTFFVPLRSSTGTMIIYTDIFSNCEMCSDAYPGTMEYDDTVLQVEGKYITVDDSGIDIGANPSAEGGDEALADGARSVVNILEAFQLQEVQYEKKEFKNMVKIYIQRVMAHLNETDPDRVAPWQAGIQAFCKWLFKNFKELQVFVGSNFDMEAGFVACKYDDAGNPIFYYIFDGLKAVKV